MKRLKNLSRKQKILLALLTLFAAFGLFIYFWLFNGLPSIGDIEKGFALPSTRIYDRNGQLLYEILPPEQGRNIVLTLDQIPQHCVNAVIATEDANFYEHPGVDVVGVARAVWINLRGGEVIAGGSTITQQLVRTVLLDPQQRAERTLQRKLKEMILALQLQSANSKDDVLTMYINQVYFGNLAYGIEGAARVYFSKSAQELSLAECALLAGIIQNAAVHDPFTNLESAEARQEIVLGLMVQKGSITQEQADTAKNDELQFASVPFPIEAPHFVMAVWSQLERDFSEQLYRDGLDVVTTVDLNWQRAAQTITNRQLDSLNHPPFNSRPPANANNAALVAIDPFTGQVLTMLGSPNYFDEAIDGAVNAAFSLRQPGSALKPFTFAAAMNPNREKPWTAATMVLDVHTPFVTKKLESYTPANYGFVEHGPVLVREALASSYNIPAVAALEDVGIAKMIELSANAGLETLIGNTDVDLAVTLGGGEVRLIDLVQAYSIFPNGGFRVEPSFILSVKKRDGETLYEWQSPLLNQRVLDERLAFIITDMLADNNARIPAFGRYNLLNIGRQAAAKTGTTTDYRDNWVVGYTPNLVVGVWVGNADNTPMEDVTGITGAAPIWNDFLRQVLMGQPELTFQQPEGVTRVEVCALSGLLPTDACQLRRWEWFIPGTEPTEYDTMYQKFVVDRETGYLADENTPPEQRREEIFIVLPQEARDWGIEAGIRQPPQNAPVQLVASDAELRLISPDPYTIYQLSPLTPVETQRIRFNVGTPSGTTSVVYSLNGQPLETVTNAPFSLWWTLQVGDHELTATATLTDGTTQTSAPVSFKVMEYVDPNTRMINAMSTPAP